MGILSTLLGNNTSQSWESLSDHNISSSKVLASTDDQVPTPRNPGQFKSVRSIPVLAEPRYFDARESKALKELAKEKKAQSKYTKEAFEAMRQIDDADVTVHTAFYEHRQYLARNEVKKLTANAKYAGELHKLRPKYADLGLGLESAERTATVKIQQMKQKMQQQWAAA